MVIREAGSDLTCGLARRSPRVALRLPAHGLTALPSLPLLACTLLGALAQSFGQLVSQPLALTALLVGGYLAVHAGTGLAPKARTGSNFSPRATIDQAIRASLWATATATTLNGRRKSMSAIHWG